MSATTYICLAILALVVFIIVLVIRKDKEIVEKIDGTHTSVKDWSRRNEEAHEQIAKDVRVTRGRVQWLAANKIAEELEKLKKEQPHDRDPPDTPTA
jgi:transposase